MDNITQFPLFLPLLMRDGGHDKSSIFKTNPIFGNLGLWSGKGTERKAPAACNLESTELERGCF